MPISRQNTATTPVGIETRDPSANSSANLISSSNLTNNGDDEDVIMRVTTPGSSRSSSRPPSWEADSSSNAADPGDPSRSSSPSTAAKFMIGTPADALSTTTTMSMGSTLQPGIGMGERSRTNISIKLDRCPLTQDEFLSSYEYHEKESASVMEMTRSAVKSGFSCSKVDWKSVLLNHVPVLRWLPNYNVKDDLIGDIIAGFTVAVMHIPQGMAYALLAGLPAVNGLYMAFFPVLVYMIFGTSRQNSVGTFAVVLLMTGTLSQEILEKYGAAPLDAIFASKGGIVNSTAETTTASPGKAVEASLIVRYHSTQTVALVAFCVGMWQILMGLMRIGALSVVLSDVLISGLTTGASMHILTSQIKGIFGVHLPRQTKFPKLLRTYLHLLHHLYESNVVALIVSTVTIAALAVNNDFIKPRLAKRCRFPIPIELIAVVGGTMYSYFMQLHDRYDLPILGEVPTGIPLPEPPPFEIMKDVLAGSMVIAVVAFTTSYSMAIIFAKRLNYEVDANQELLAHGLSNILGSFFQCGPSAASLSRSLIQHAVGGKTQISSAISACLILVILLFLGPLFGPLPKCILSCIIIVSLKGLFVQFADFGRAWSSSKLDALIWISTFASVVIIDIDYGLLIGVSVSLVTLLWRNQRAYACILGEIPKTGIYVDSQRFAAAKEIHNVKIFHYGAGLHFANRDFFREVLFSLTGLDPVRWHKQAMKRIKKERTLMEDAIKGHSKPSKKSLRRVASFTSASTTTTMRSHGSSSCSWFCWGRRRRHEDVEESLGQMSMTSSLGNLGSQISESKSFPSMKRHESIRPAGSANSTEIREITIDVKSLSGGVTVGDSLALPASTGLRLRRRSIHIDTTGHPLPFRYLLIDLSGISFIDMAGVKLLKSLVQDYDRINIQVLFAGPTEPVLHMFRKMSFYKDVPKQCFFPTVNDAVVCIQWRVVGLRKEKLTSVSEHEEEHE